MEAFQESLTSQSKLLEGDRVSLTGRILSKNFDRGVLCYDVLPDIRVELRNVVREI